MYIQDIDEHIQKMKNQASAYEIYFVVNVVGKTDSIDYINTEQTILTEYLTEDEYDSMITALKNCQFHIKLFNDEKQFIYFVLQNETKISFNHVIVFNLARNGKGLNKKALIPAFCQLYNLKLTGSGAYNVCLGRHKFHTNCILKSKEIPVPKTWYFTANGWILDEEPPYNQKLIIKPCFESASRGITDSSIIAYSAKSKCQIEELQVQFEQSILVQEFIEGYEVQVPVIKFSQTITPLMAVGISIISMPLLSEKIITYDIAYDETYEFYDFSQINTQVANAMKQAAVQACQVLGLEHYCRFDFRVDMNGNFYITDISTHPFLIKHSAFAFAFSSLGYDYEDIFLLLISLITESER